MSVSEFVTIRFRLPLAAQNVKEKAPCGAFSRFVKRSYVLAFTMPKQASWGS